MASKSMFYPCACGKTFKQFRLLQRHVQVEEVVYHCGVFICMYANFMSSGSRLSFNQTDIPYFRNRMLYEIITQKII